MPAINSKTTPRLHDGVMKRGTTWSYVIRVKDPETGVSKPRWAAASPPSKTPGPHETRPG